MIAIFLAGYRWATQSEMFASPDLLPVPSALESLFQGLNRLGVVFVFVGSSLALAVTQLVQRQWLYSATLFTAFAIAVAIQTLLPGFHWKPTSNRFGVLLGLCVLGCVLEFWVRKPTLCSRWSVGLAGAAFASYYIFLSGQISSLE